jgi:enamine deaminase RidA (YjgF/YER057c/UK114 family)
MDGVERRRVASGAPWEAVVGYCRAVRAGSHIVVSGTTAVDEHGQPVAPGDAYAQTAHALSIIDRALRELGASKADIVRTRLFVTDIRRWEDVGRAHREFFRDMRPATTMVQVSALIDPALVVEIEADAIVG